MASNKFHLRSSHIFLAVILLCGSEIARANRKLCFFYLHTKKSAEKCFAAIKQLNF